MSAFSTDIEALSNSLYAYARKRVQSEDDILDLIQDTLADYMARPENFRKAASELSYLTGILRNKIFELYRKQARESVPGDEAIGAILDDHGVDPLRMHPSEAALEKMAADALASRIMACVRQLKPPYFQAFVLREIDELSTDEICKIMGVTITNLNVILHRARGKLQVMLKKEGVINANSGLA